MANEHSETLKYVFFDIGGTLGKVTISGNQAQLALFANTKQLLQRLGRVVKLGIISNVPSDMSTSDVVSMLTGAGIVEYFAPGAIITSTDATTEKPDPAIYQFAASKVGLPVGACMFVGEDLAEVVGALVAGMHAQSPGQVEECCHDSTSTK